ncbi:MAG: proteobacterial dedicated sortase system response regulator [Gammaproteobacteria bacterium]|nr:proteobacterial dedicated sortase system response regulator [Gammaproteobacteria bacterium]
MPRVIAVVEDEEAIRENYASAMRRQGYAVQGFADRRSALEAFRRALPDLVVLDIGLGDEVEGGFELCRELRNLSVALPIIFLTARDSDLDIVSGLRLGADDFLSKDASLVHLLARIAALLRRVDALQAPSTANVITRGALSLDLDRMTVSWGDAVIVLTVTEFWILHALVRYPGHVKNRDQLMQEANVLVDDATITSHIKRIRRKFEANDTQFEAIETVYGMGYRWLEPQ